MSGNKSPVLKRDVKELLRIAKVYAEEYAKKELESKVDKLDISHVMSSLKALERFKITADIDDYNEYTEAISIEEKDEQGDWVRANDIDRIINCS